MERKIIKIDGYGKEVLDLEQKTSNHPITNLVFLLGVIPTLYFPYWFIFKCSFGTGVGRFFISVLVVIIYATVLRKLTLSIIKKRLINNNVRKLKGGKNN